jgi:hypothetical protein
MTGAGKVHKVTLNLTTEQIQRLKDKQAYPYECGGESFAEDTVVYADSLVKFAANKSCPFNTITKKLVLDPYLKYEELNEATKETD